MKSPPRKDASHHQSTSPSSRPSVPTSRSPSAILGDISWLMMESPWHRARMVSDFARLVLPPIKLRQFRLYHDGHIPIAFISWAMLSPEAERRYIDDPLALKLDDWMSGNAIYIADFVASAHAVRRIASYLRRDPLLSTGPVRGLKKRNDARMIIEVFTDDRGRHVKASRLPHANPADATSPLNESIHASSITIARPPLTDARPSTSTGEHHEEARPTPETRIEPRLPTLHESTTNESLDGRVTPSATTQLMFDPESQDFIRDPYPFYERLRANDRVHLTPTGNYVVTRHVDVSLVLRDKRFGKDFTEKISRRYGPQVIDEPAFQGLRHSMMQQDPPDHTRLRGLMVNAFTARRVEEMRPRIQQIVDDALDRVEKLGRMDLIQDFAYRLPITVILDLLGIPEDQRDRFYRPSPDRGRLIEPIPLSRAEIDKANAGTLSARGYFQQLCELRRKQPGDDLITQLVQAEDESLISNLETISNIMMLFSAGHETMVSLIGNGLLALFRHPDQLNLLKAHPELITNAVEEFLRYDAPVQMARRVALEDIDDLGGKPIAKGELVICSLGSANRDPAVYPDHPDRLDITRSNTRALSFGGGIHFCLGAQLARVEAELAIGTLLRRIPGIRPDDVDHPKWRPTFVLRCLRELPASW